MRTNKGNLKRRRTLQNAATHRDTSQHTATHCTHCNTLQQRSHGTTTIRATASRHCHISAATCLLFLREEKEEEKEEGKKKMVVVLQQQ